MPWIYLFAALLSTAAGQLTYKLYYQRKARWLLGITLALFLLSSFFSYLAQRDLSLDVVYMATSLTIVMVMAGSALWLGETVERRHVLGAGLIIGGILLYNWSGSLG
jgi:multidrug transporter EmrE-like cation transporter